MSTTKCGHTTPCGCADVALTTPAPCTPVGCPDPYPCSEITPAECVIYTGSALLCDNTVVVEQDVNVAVALETLVDYFCNAISGIQVYDIVAGAGINVQESTVGTTTTYTISTEVAPLKKFVKEHTFPDALSTDIFILQGELQDCNFPGVEFPCGLEGLPTDIIIKGYFFNPDINYWVEFTHQDATIVNIDNSGSIFISASLVPAPVFPPGGINARIVIIG